MEQVKAAIVKYLIKRHIEGVYIKGAWWRKEKLYLVIRVRYLELSQDYYANSASIQHMKFEISNLLPTYFGYLITLLDMEIHEIEKIKIPLQKDHHHIQYMHDSKNKHFKNKRR